MHVLVCVYVFVSICKYIYVYGCTYVRVCVCVYTSGKGQDWVWDLHLALSLQAPLPPSIALHPTICLLLNPALCFLPCPCRCEQISRTQMLKKQRWRVLWGGGDLLPCFWSKLCFSLDWLAASWKVPNIIAFKNWLNLEGGGSLQQSGSRLQIVWL